MPRPLRLVDDNSYQHIITRGNDRRRIFRAKDDYAHFLKIISEELNKFSINIYHYCLMSNHIHLLIKVGKREDTPKFFQVVLQRYANYFKKRYHNHGYLYQGRYKNRQIDKENYLLDCARYIERNPLRAKIVKHPEEYKWSSYLYYASGIKDVIIKEPNPLYLELGNSDEERQKRYIEYINQERPYELLIDKGLMIE